MQLLLSQAKQAKAGLTLRASIGCIDKDIKVVS